jgi:hypothetical protein
MHTSLGPLCARGPGLARKAATFLKEGASVSDYVTVLSRNDWGRCSLGFGRGAVRGVVRAASELARHLFPNLLFSATSRV